MNFINRGLIGRDVDLDRTVKINTPQRINGVSNIAMMVIEAAER
jgi:hypothetical protein